MLWNALRGVPNKEIRERKRPFFLEISFTSDYITQLLEIDTRTSCDGMEILGEETFFLEIDFTSRMMETVAPKSGDLQIDNFMRH